MNRRRCELSAGEIADLHERLDRQLGTIGLETQPRVAARILELVQNPESQLKDYTEAIRTDPALTGKLLRLANSAFYAQRTPVTRLDRALVLLGLERTKSMSLGFYLVRGAATPEYRQLSRGVWGESVYRAGLCASLAKQVYPSIAAEAFIVGLLLDCAQPIMARLLGDPYIALRQRHPSPSRLYTAEFNQLEFTHVDAAAALMRRWRMPALLARPIIWHHIVPPAPSTEAPGAPAARSGEPREPGGGGGGAASGLALQRLAYYAGAVELDPAGQPGREPPLPSVATRLLGLSAEELAIALERAGTEYQAAIELFSDHAERCADVESLAERVQQQLIVLMEEQLRRSVQAEARPAAGEFVVSGQRIELERGRPGVVVAYLASNSGERIISCTVNAATDGPERLCQRLGIEKIAPAEAQALAQAVKRLAA